MDASTGRERPTSAILVQLAGENIKPDIPQPDELEMGLKC
jgi:hypothetical protein